MASQELRRLWKLSRIDNALLEIRKRAAALDVGAAITAQIQRLEKEDATIGASARALHAEQRDLELRQKSIEEKIKQIDKEIYSGKVVGAREIENLEKEKLALKRQRDRDDERLLELFDLVPPAAEAAKKIVKQIEEAKARLADRRAKAKQEKVLLEQEFVRLNAARPEAAATISAPLLARYDSIRQRTGGIGMVDIHGTSCGGCGTNLPERTLQALREDKAAICEACHRLLYLADGVV